MKLKPFHPLSQGLIMSFLLNENGGSRVYDATGNQNHGTGANIAWGRDGIDLAGVNEHITIPAFIGMDEDWTIFLSFTQDTRNPSTQSDYTHFVSMQDGSSGTGRSIFFIGDRGTPTYKLRSYVCGSLQESDTAIEINTAYTAGLTNDGTSFHFYLNGVDDGSFIDTAAAVKETMILFDQKAATGNGCFDGTAGVVHIYNRSLSAAEMMWLDNDSLGMFDPDHVVSSAHTPATIRELSATIAATTALGAAELEMLREITSAMAAQTGSSADIDILREMDSVSATSTATATSELNILREAVAAIAATTSLSLVGLTSLRELAASSSATSASAAELAVLREITMGCAPQTYSSASLDIVREISTTLSSTTSSSSAELAVLREIIATVASQSSSSALIHVLREMQATVASGTSLSQVELVLATLRDLSTVMSATTATSAPSTNILREMSGSVASSTASAAQIDIIREMVSIIQSHSSSLAEVSVLRGLLSVIDASTVTSASDMIFTRELATTVTISTDANSLNLPVLREFATTMSASTSTIDTAIDVIRALSAQIESGTDVDAATLLVISGLSATIDAETAASIIDLLVMIPEVIIDPYIRSVTPKLKILSISQN